MINRVILVGNLGADVELKYMPNGSEVAQISLATTRRWTDKQTNERKEATEWHRVVFFSKLAEIVNQYTHKGSKIYVEGRLQTRKWTDNAGVERYTTEIIAESMHMLDSKESGGQAQEQSPPQQRPAKQAPQQQRDNFDDAPYDDDIPF
jgi:single-strand DNA-binding protein